MIENPHDGAGMPAAEDIVLAEAGAAPELLEALSPPDGGEGASSPRARRSAQERIDEVTRARREAEREADYWRTIAYEAAAQLDALAQTGGQDGGPDPNDYVHGEDDADFIRDQVQHQMRKEYEREAHDFAMAHEDHRLSSLFAERERAVADRLPDYHAAVYEAGQCGAWPCSREMAEAIKTSEVGPELAYLLAHNPEAARRIASLSHASQLRELGRLEGLLLHRGEAQPNPKTATAAPEPPPVVRGGGGRFPIAPDTNDFAAFDKQYG
jgi:hypothetical protein